MTAELIANLIDEIRDFGFEKVFRRYYGIYRAEVTDTTDINHRGRIKVKIPDLFGDKALPNMALPKDFRVSGDKKGEFFPPDTGDFCWIEFENGDPRFPVYSGGWYAENELPDEFEYDSTDKPFVKGFVGRGGQKMLFKETPDAEQWTFRTKGGHFFVLDDTVDAEGIFLIHKSGAQIQLDKNGSIKALGQNGSFINIDSNPDEEDPAITVTSKEGAYASVGKDIKLSDSSGENFATINDKGVTLNAAAGALINGNSLGVSVGTIDIKDTTKAGLKIANGQVALGNVTVEVVDTIIKIIDALTDGSPLVTTGTGPSSGLLPPALVNLTLLKTLLTPLKGSL